MTVVFNTLKKLKDSGCMDTFSEEIKLLKNNGDEVKVAGKIITIANMETHYQITLEDGIGEIRIITTPDVYGFFKKKYDFAINDLVVCEGKVVKNKNSYGNEVFVWKIEKPEELHDTEVV